MTDINTRGILTQKPGPTEYGDFYKGYIDHLPDDVSVLKILEEQPSDLIRLLESLSEEEALYRYAPGKWTIKQVLGHLTDTERIFSYRALSLARGEEKELPGFDQDKYVEAAGFDERQLANLLDEYKAVREATLQLFEGFTGTMLGMNGIVNSNPCSVRAIAFIIAGHERHHIRLLKESYGLGKMT